mmetsp:Transcript_1723/g.2641  ORF Transcript_1723/g.2641 Transcript_1723/m.2641 type:complete len:103 (-) Transcript_1723:42-350(-)
MTQRENQGRKRPQEILDFVSAKIHMHFKAIKYHAEKVEIYQFIAEDLEQIYCRCTPDESVAFGEAGDSSTRTTTRDPDSRTRYRFAPDSEEEDTLEEDQKRT